MKFHVQAEVTISITAEVEASDAAAARKIARGLHMPGLCHQCSRGNRDDDTWCVDELDGEARSIRVTADNEE